MSKTHGLTGTRIYRIWKCMRTRCNNPNRKDYKNYGGRGIKLCPEWDNFLNFYEWAMANGYDDSLTIERIDVDKGYEPNNCCWITNKEQAKNKQDTLRLIYKGKPISAIELSKITGISKNTIYTAHRMSGRIDFSDYEPKHADVKNVTKRNEHRYEVNIKGKYIGQYPTLEQAIEVRDNILGG